MPTRRYEEAAAALSAAQALTVRRLQLAAEVAAQHAVICQRTNAAIAASHRLLDRINQRATSFWPPYHPEWSEEASGSPLPEPCSQPPSGPTPE